MKKRYGIKPKKRTQGDYSYSFKLQIVEEVEFGQLSYKMAQRGYDIQGHATVRIWAQEYGIFA